MAPDLPDSIFKTSSYTENAGTCVEVARLSGYVAVRDTKYRSGGHISVPPRAFQAFLNGVRR
ncbi:hypothetical protein GCM10022243_52670 [Saccharothrix violaceirubra]|uniref:DUF397 domain-containing protein n=1 Tax=Saccharothrix violaceirubra TaxID=413306 RepID=A0A7W7SYP8_9PSEU|nr:DUF397 domain-containing protein [Saccharothrix violaceirubra]MBB4963329.1 hypothetical protein [Saccharothrix violaceirubra]